MRTMKHLAFVAIAASALALAGCGGGSSGGGPVSTTQTTTQTTTPDPVSVALPTDLPSEYAPAAGSMTIEAGMSRTSNGVMFSCASDGDDCMVTVAADGMVSSTGGMVTAALTKAVMDIVASRSNEETRTAHRTAANTAITAAQTAANGVNDDSTDAQVASAEMAVKDAENAVTAATALTADERAELMALVTAADVALTTAKTSRMMAMNDAEKAATAAMAATAAKLFAGIARADGATDSSATTDRAVGILPDDADNSILTLTVNYGSGDNTAVAQLLVDKDTTVADNHGWTGRRYVQEADDGAITEAYVYSDEMPTEGAKFNSGTGDGNVGFELLDGAVTLSTDLNQASRIASPRFTHTAGSHTFEVPEDNPDGVSKLNFSGSYYGVAGTYTCTPATGACSVVRGANGGYTFGNPTAWAFKPTDPEARITESADTLYATYGWWLRTEADGDLNASAFQAYVAVGVAEPTVTGLDGLNGSATYTGGAAGKYALSSSTGGENDAGHFTARAMLEADFDTEMVSGTVDNFMSDGEAKNWSVELKKSGFGADGAIAVGTDSTVWTIGDDAADASGRWRGNLREVDADSGVPGVVTGDFYTEFGNSGKMVGGFGAKTE